MGKLQEFDITFTNNKVVYAPGESISGTVKIRTGNSLQYKGNNPLPHLFTRYSDGSPRAATRRKAHSSMDINFSSAWTRGTEVGGRLWATVRHVCTLQPEGGRFSGTSCFSQALTSMYCLAFIKASWLLWVKDTGTQVQVLFWVSPGKCEVEVRRHRWGSDL